MLLTPTDEPRYLDVIRAARDAGIGLPSPLAHLLLVLATHYPEMRPTYSKLASHVGCSVRTVERNLSALTDRGWLVSLSIPHGFERGGRSYRFLVLPTLSPLGAEPVLVGRGPDGWQPQPFDLPTLVTVDRCRPTDAHVG